MLDAHVEESNARKLAAYFWSNDFLLSLFLCSHCVSVLFWMLRTSFDLTHPRLLCSGSLLGETDKAALWKVTPGKVNALM